MNLPKGQALTAAQKQLLCNTVIDELLKLVGRAKNGGSRFSPVVSSTRNNDADFRW